MKKISSSFIGEQKERNNEIIETLYIVLKNHTIYYMFNNNTKK